MSFDKEPDNDRGDRTAITEVCGIDRATLIDLIVDLWRIRRRAQRDDATPPSVRVACEVAMDRVAALGFRVDELLGAPYDPSMQVRVVEQEGGAENLRISECLSPAIYTLGENGQLVRRAEVIVRGE